jgi:hypothetical protein
VASKPHVRFPLGNPAGDIFFRRLFGKLPLAKMADGRSPLGLS